MFKRIEKRNKTLVAFSSQRLADEEPFYCRICQKKYIACVRRYGIRHETCDKCVTDTLFAEKIDALKLQGRVCA